MIRKSMCILGIVALTALGNSNGHGANDNANGAAPDTNHTRGKGMHGMMGWMHGKGQNQEGQDERAEDHAYELFVHPFLAHMGIPDEPGEVSLRVTALQTNDKGDLEQDLGFHIEAGIAPHLGIHLRSDGITTQQFSEVMLQYAPWISRGRRYGVAIFGQLSVPTGRMDSEEYRALAGVSGLVTAGRVMVFDGNVHYDFQETAAELEGTFIFRTPYGLYPIVEGRGHVGGEHKEAYLLPALKWAIRPHIAFGAGFQFPLTDEREYDVEALFTFDIAFQ